MMTSQSSIVGRLPSEITCLLFFNLVTREFLAGGLLKAKSISVTCEIDAESVAG